MQSSAPVESVAPCLERAAFATSSIPSGGIALAHLHGCELEPSEISIRGVSAGFRVEVVSVDHKHHATQLIVVLRLHRVDARAGEACTVRFWGAGRTCDASLTVRHQALAARG